MKCKKCGCEKHVKNGTARGHQRYKCLECGCVFTDTPPRGKPPEMKALAVLLYALGNASFGMIGRLLGVSNVSVLRWIRAEAMSVQTAEISEESKIIQVDEMWHFVNGKKTKFGSGRPMILAKSVLLDSRWVGVMMEL